MTDLQPDENGLRKGFTTGHMQNNLEHVSMD